MAHARIAVRPHGFRRVLRGYRRPPPPRATAGLVTHDAHADARPRRDLDRHPARAQGDGDRLDLPPVARAAPPRGRRRPEAPRRRAPRGPPHGLRPWVADRYARVLETCAETVTGVRSEIELVPFGSGDEPPSAPSAASATPAQARERASGLTLNPKYTSEPFVIGDANRFGHAAALSVAELPGQAYNPLFLHGAPGLGKTHLLHAIGNYLAAHDPSARVRYTTIEAFTNHFTGSIQRKAMEPFKASYRDQDVLLIDDIQFLAEKARTEDELFHTFNALYERGAQIVVTSDRLPADLDALEERLRARFSSGLVCALGAPDLASRLAILAKRVQHDGIELEDEGALLRIAERIPDNGRPLEGALTRVVSFGSLTRRPVDRALVDEVLDGLYPLAPAVPRSVADVKAAVAETFGVSEEDLCSPSRKAEIAWPRQVGMYLARELTDASLPAIGQAFGGRNHATVLHACKRTSERIAGDRAAFDAVENVSERLKRTESDRCG